MPETFKCPNCGAPLDYQGGDPIIRCPYCSTSVVVPDNLRAQPSFSSQPGNFTLSGSGDMTALVQKAARFKQVKDLATGGKKIEAIKAYREITGSDLRTAKDAVDALAANQPITLSGLVTSDQGGGSGASIETGPAGGAGRTGLLAGCLGVVVLAIVLGLGLLFASGPLGLGNTLPGLPILGFTSQQLSFGGNGVGPGLFTQVQALAVDPATGAIFAADHQGGRVQAFDPTGKFLTQWIMKGRFSDTYITGMAADRQGHVFVVMDGYVYRYDAMGKLQKMIQLPDVNLYNLVVTADGNLVGAGNGEAIVQFTPDGNVTSTYKDVITTNGGDTDSGVLYTAVDGNGDIYEISTNNSAVFRYSPDGKYLSHFGGAGDQNGELRYPRAIAIDGFGRVFVADNKGIQVFDTQGHFQNLISTPDNISAMAFDDQNNLYVAAQSADGNNKITKYTVQKPGGN